MSLRGRLHSIIFEAETPLGRVFDISLLVAIIVSVLAVVLESVGSLEKSYGDVFQIVEWVLTGLFTVEYLLRVFCVHRPWKYIFSFYGLVDLISIIPTYLSLYFTGMHSLVVIRSLRLLRVFRVLKLGRFLKDANVLMAAMRNSRAKIIVFLTTVLSLALIMGTIMYLVEGETNGFTSIPKSIYWAIVTMTTVGYGDIAPQTVLGQTIASALMIVGYAIIAVPTGIVSVELANASEPKCNTITCPSCQVEGHDTDAVFCRFCGVRLDDEEES